MSGTTRDGQGTQGGEKDAACPGCAGTWDEPPWIGCTRPWHHASHRADIFDDATTPPVVPAPADPNEGERA